MTVEGILFVVIQLSLLLNWPVAGILIFAARRKPPIRALQVMAVSSTLIAAGLTVYVWAVVNSALGYLIPKEAAQIVFRAVLIALAAFPIWFLWLFLTNRFKDELPAERDVDAASAKSRQGREGVGVQVDNVGVSATVAVDDANNDALSGTH